MFVAIACYCGWWQSSWWHMQILLLIPCLFVFRPDLNSVTISYIPSLRTPVHKDRNHTPSSHPSGVSYSLSSTQPSPHAHSHHSSPLLGGMGHHDPVGQRSLPHPFSPHAPSHHSTAMGSPSNVPQIHGNTPVMQSNMPQQLLNGSNSSDSTMMGRGVLPERRSPAIGQPAQNPTVAQMEMNPLTPGKKFWYSCTFILQTFNQNLAYFQKSFTLQARHWTPIICILLIEISLFCSLISLKSVKNSSINFFNFDCNLLSVNLSLNSVLVFYYNPT